VELWALIRQLEERLRHGEGADAVAGGGPGPVATAAVGSSMKPQVSASPVRGSPQKHHHHHDDAHAHDRQQHHGDDHSGDRNNQSMMSGNSHSNMSAVTGTVAPPVNAADGNSFGKEPSSAGSRTDKRRPSTATNTGQSHSLNDTMMTTATSMSKNSSIRRSQSDCPTVVEDSDRRAILWTSYSGQRPFLVGTMGHRNAPSLEMSKYRTPALVSTVLKQERGHNSSKPPNLDIFKTPAVRRPSTSHNVNVYSKEMCSWVPSNLTGKYNERFQYSADIVRWNKINAMLDPSL
jgi:hypothetical protein